MLQTGSVSFRDLSTSKKNKTKKTSNLHLTLDEYATALILHCHCFIYMYREKKTNKQQKGFLIYFCDSFRLTLCGICKGEKVRG